MTRLHAPAYAFPVSAAALLILGACEPQDIRTPTPSNVGSVSQSQTGTGLDASELIITPVDLSKIEVEDMPAQMLRDMNALTDLFVRARDQVDVEGALKQVELAGLNYRTLSLRVEQELDDGNDALEAAYADLRPRLRRAHRDLMTTGRDLAARYPDIRRDIEERFDKFDFGPIAANRQARDIDVRTGGADADG